MKLSCDSLRLFAACACATVLLGGCGGSGDIKINPTTVDNSTNNSNNTTTQQPDQNQNPCASFTTSGGQTKQGTYDGTNCTYNPAFVDSGNNLMVDLTIPALPNGGANIFQGSLFVGGAYNSDAELQAAGITQGGDGPRLTIEAGAILAWESNSKFMVINRGSQIFAVGTANAPITLTSVSDINGDLASDPEAVSQWGGLVIDGFAVTNKCSYTGTRGDPGFALSGECHVASEGSAGQDENYYGGANDDDNSGRIEYLIVKHTGAQVANGDELNGITWGAVGRGTVVKNLEAYSVFDDGMEFFGGAVDITNYVAVYARDDSFDIDEGWQGTLQTALVIQSETDGNNCIEADGLGSYSDLTDTVRDDFITRNLNSRPTINNMTCIISANSAATATHEPGAGWHFREGIWPTVNDSMIIASFGPDSADDNTCLNMASDKTAEGAQNNDFTLNSVIIACVDRASGMLPNGTSTEDWATAAPNSVIFATVGGVVNPTAATDTQLVLLEGTPPIFSVDYASMVVDDAAPAGAPQSGDFIGALSQSVTDPFEGWAYGIFDGNRAEPLWFE